VTDAYRQFLEAKMATAPAAGFDVAVEEVNPALKDFVQAIVRWAAEGGRRAIFSSFGLHKTSTQIELARLALAKTGAVPLLVVPLGVRHEFMEEAATRFTGDCRVRMNFIRRTDEAEADAINLTNYESVREGKVDPARFGFASLDEAAILRGLGGTKTFRSFMASFPAVRYRFVATATPDPNAYIELLAYAAFLDVMDVGQAKTRWFKRDSEKADALTLHPHKEREFWLWVASWALFVRRPSDLGFSDDGYVRPKVVVRWHEVASDHAAAGHERDGQARMFRDAAVGVVDAAAEKRATIGVRVERLMGIIGDVVKGRASSLHESLARQEQGDAPSQSAGMEQASLSGEQGDIQGQVGGVARGQPRTDEGIAGGAPSEKRGEATRSVTELVREQQGSSNPAGAGAETGEIRADIGRLRAPSGASERDMRDLSGPAAGRATALCGPLPSRGAGSRPSLPSMQFCDGPSTGSTGTLGKSLQLSQQFIVWCDLNAEQRAVDAALGEFGLTASSLYGSQDIEERERLMVAWRKKLTVAFVSKPSMYGSGVNMQQSHRMVFLGIGHKFHDFIQAIHRCQRYGQAHTVEVDLIYTEAEREIRRSLEAKWRRHDEQAETMSRILREYGLAGAAMAHAMARQIGVRRAEVGGDGWRLVNADCVEETRTLPADEVGLIVTSIPFATQYEYTPSFNDFGHTDDNAHFWRQMDFLTPELLRVLAPGRVCAVHVKDRIVPGGLTGLGFQTVQPFHAEAIDHYRRHGFAYLGMKTIVTDVVRENNQTYRLGWSEQCKDGSRMGPGLPEYILLFRKPPTDRSNGYADVPVEKPKPLCDDHGEPAPFDKRRNWKQPVPGTGYSRARWQLDAHAFSRSSGDRLLSSAELAGLPHEQLYKLWRERSTGAVYDFGGHVAVAEDMDHMQRLPSTFMLLPPHSWHPDIWSDVARMRTLNTMQAQQGREAHLCPLQFDIVDRLIGQFTMPGELVYDPFGGLMTVPYCAVKLGRRALGVELNAGYFADGVAHVRAAAEKAATPTLFDLLAADEDAA